MFEHGPKQMNRKIKKKNSFLDFSDDDLSTVATSLMAVHVVFVAIIGSTANLCVFLALSTGHKVSNNLLLLNLCVADSMVCIISGPLTVLSWEWPALSSYAIVNAAQVRRHDFTANKLSGASYSGVDLPPLF